MERSSTIQPRRLIHRSIGISCVSYSWPVAPCAWSCCPAPGPLPQLLPDDGADGAGEIRNMGAVPPLPGPPQRILHRVLEVLAGQGIPGVGTPHMADVR